MNKYKNRQMKKLIKVLGVSLFGLFGLIVTILNDYSSHTIGFMVGLSVSTFIIFIGLAIDYYKLIHDEEVLRKKYIECNDERNQLIEAKVDIVSFQCLIIVLIILTIVFAFIDLDKMVLTSSILWITIILKVVLYMYYKKKL